MDRQFPYILTSPDTTQKETAPIMQTKNLYTRWYRVVMYLGLGVLLVAGIVASIVGFVLDSHQEDLLESDFVGACYAAGIQTGQDITARHCRCVWNELRKQYDVDEIAEWMRKGTRDPQFEIRFDTAVFACE